jgi:hypothetical protein
MRPGDKNFAPVIYIDQGFEAQEHASLLTTSVYLHSDGGMGEPKDPVPGVCPRHARFHIDARDGPDLVDTDGSDPGPKALSTAGKRSSYKL